MSQESSQTTIEALSTELLLEVFEFLDAYSLKQCSQVCARWDSVIGESVSTMRKLPLIFRTHWQDRGKEINSLRRAFHTVVFDSVEINTKLLKAVSNLGEKVRQLEIDNVKSTDGTLSLILNSMPMLENIRISESKIDLSSHKEEITPSSLRSIKSLILIKSFWGFLDFIRKTQVRSLKISASTYTTVDAISLKKFMKKQTYLETLAVSITNGQFFIDLEKVSEKNRRFEPKNLAVDFKHWGDAVAIDEAFAKFMTNHSSTLESLEISRKVSEAVLKAIMGLRIKRLLVDATDFTSSQTFFRDIRPNKELQTLVINGLETVDVAHGLLGVYSTIQKLIIDSCSDEIMSEVLIFIANNCKRLEHLEIPQLSNNSPELPIASLKTFRVDFVGAANEWQTFCSSNPSIERLIVKWTSNRNEFTYEVLDNVTSSLPNLKHILFGVYFKPTSRIVDMIGRNCRQFQLLEVFDDIPGERLNSSTHNANFRIHYYHRDVADLIFKREPSSWSNCDIEFSDDGFDDGDRHILGDDDDFSDDDDMEYGDNDFMDDGDDLGEFYGFNPLLNQIFFG